MRKRQVKSASLYSGLVSGTLLSISWLVIVPCRQSTEIVKSFTTDSDQALQYDKAATPHNCKATRLNVDVTLGVAPLNPRGAYVEFLERTLPEWRE